MRYASEVAVKEKHYAVKLEARQTYEEANRIPLRATNVTKLQLVLNYTVFLFEVMKRQNDAIKYAENALTDAVNHLDMVTDLEFDDVSELMNLIKSNLSDWKDHMLEK